MAEQSSILELYIDNKKVDEVKVFGSNDVNHKIKELKYFWAIDEKTYYEFWLTCKSKINFKNE